MECGDGHGGVVMGHRWWQSLCLPGVPSPAQPSPVAPVPSLRWHKPGAKRTQRRSQEREKILRRDLSGRWCCSRRTRGRRDATGGGAAPVKENRDVRKRSGGGGESEGETAGDSLLEGWGAWDARDGERGCGDTP